MNSRSDVVSRGRTLLSLMSSTCAASSKLTVLPPATRVKVRSSSYGEVLKVVKLGAKKQSKALLALDRHDFCKG